jgi:predicted RNA-binding Zn ribbon-like protein
MKKVYHGEKETFLSQIHGKIHIWDHRIVDEIVEAANKGLKNEMRATIDPESIVYRELCEWMTRYLKECVTDDKECVTDNFLNDLNTALYDIRYAKHLLPLDLLPSGTGSPRSVYIADFNETPEPEEIAADDFSKLLSSGMLKRLKRCRMPGCERFFIGPRQAKWCSKTCGSKFRVREKRKRDSS